MARKNARTTLPTTFRTDNDDFAVEPLGLDEDCTCLVCRAANSDWAAGKLEQQIMLLVTDLLDAGWRPKRIVAEMKQRARRGPFAEELVKIALICQAGRWLSVPDKYELLDEVDEFADTFHHHVGTTIPGWLARWLNEEVDAPIGLEGVVDVLELLPGVFDTSTETDAPNNVIEIESRRGTV
jgi:hypothetical protein